MKRVVKLKTAEKGLLVACLVDGAVHVMWIHSDVDSFGCGCDVNVGRHWINTYTPYTYIHTYIHTVYGRKCSRVTSCQELLVSVGSLEFSGGKAQIAKVSKCSGDAFLVIVRNKKRVGYTYELTLKIKGEWIVKEEKRMVKGHLDFPEFSFGELDDLQMQVRLSDEKDLSRQDMLQISQNLKLFLQPVREKLLQFEQELKDR
ncbi:hypothetical protein Peur_031468 [Populus x canadensis]